MAKQDQAAAVFKNGDKVNFYPSPRSTDMISGTVSGTNVGVKGTFIQVRDGDGKVRSVRPARCQRLAA